MFRFPPSTRAFPALLFRLMLSSTMASCLAITGCHRNGFPEYPDTYREFAYVTNTGGASVSVLDLVGLKLATTLKVAPEPVAAIANPKRNEVYIVSRHTAQSTGSVAIIDTTKSSVAATIPVGRNPQAIVVTPSGEQAYVVNLGSDSVTQIDLDRRRAIATIPVGRQPTGLAMAPDGRTLAVTSGADGSLLLFALDHAERRITAPRASFHGCPGAASPVILPDSSKVFVACADGHQVLVAGLAMQAGSWAVRQDASLMQDQLLTLLDVGQKPTYLTLKPDGGEIFVSNSGSDSISEIATTQNEVGSTYPIGNHPGHGIVSADGTRLWVSSRGADAISLYSIEEGKFVSSLPAGGAPDALASSADEHLLLAADARTGDVAVIRTQSKLGPILLTMLPTGADPTAIAIKAMQVKP